MGTPSPRPSICNVLDALESRSQLDDTSLLYLADLIVQNKSLLTFFGLSASPDSNLDSVRLTRPSLAAALQWVRFDQWQSADWLELKDDKSGQEMIRIEPQWSSDLALATTNQPRWMRVVDLALFDVLGREVRQPFSPNWLDTCFFTLNRNRLARFLQCARFHSWSVEGWSAPDGVANMRGAIAGGSK